MMMDEDEGEDDDDEATTVTVTQNRRRSAPSCCTVMDVDDINIDACNNTRHHCHQRHSSSLKGRRRQHDLRMLFYFFLATAAFRIQSNAFVSFSRSRFAKNHYNWLIYVASSSSAPPLSSQAASSSSSFESFSSLTVKELRELVKEQANVNGERGVLSRLKRKQELVDYLMEQQEQQNSSSADEPSSGTSDADPSVTTTPTTTTTSRNSKVPLQMPSMQTTTRTGAGSTTTKHPSSSSVVLPQSPKDAIFELVYQRYPIQQQQQADAEQDYDTNTNVLRNDDEDDDDDDVDTTIDKDVRQLYHPMLRNATASCDMDLVFVGTASCTPGTTRGVSCTALRLNGRQRRQGMTFRYNNNNSEEQSTVTTSDGGNNNAAQGGTWLFDVGECTQLQVQRTSAIRPSKINKIFLTHAHGDHSFGLPGLLCLMGQDKENRNHPVEIYGPEGLRMWLRVAIRYSVSRICPPYRVHEVMNIPMAPEFEFNARTKRFFYKGRRTSSSSPSSSWGTKGIAGEDPSNWISQANKLPLQASSLYGEIDGGRDIYPIYDHPLSSDGAPVWEVEDEDDVKVYAAPMSHGIPCLGYVVSELPRPGRLRSELVEPIVRRNVKALKKAGFAVPMKAMAVIKNLSPGSSFTFPDGTVLTQEEAVEPPRKGRKIVICGDTADSRALLALAQDADVVVHEATNSYLPGVDNKDTSLRDVTRDAIIHGHSTPQMAADFCRRTRAKRLVLNHFSPRYKGDTTVDSLSIMMRIEQQAIKASGLDETQVAAAWDLMVLPVPPH